MNKTFIISALSIVIILLLSPWQVQAQNLDAVSFEITLNTKDDGNIEVKEIILLQSNTNESINNLNFWIQNGADNVVILVNDREFTYEADEERYSVNISKIILDKGDQVTIEITYILDKNTQNFEKKLFQDTTHSIMVTYDGKLIYSSINNKIGSQFTIPIYKTVETTEESPFLYYSIIIILLILIIIIFIYSFKIKKAPKSKEIISATEEVLTTKKSLLMSLLKDLEKQYRTKEISDDTYHKIKEQYKQEAVETMKKLDDITKSKVQ